MAGIYLHIPFCTQACHYCNFYFVNTLAKKDELIATIAKELISRKDELEDEEVETIYFGGGTPSLLSQRDLEFLMGIIYHNFSVKSNIEFTFESNPEDLKKEKIQLLHQLGVNRLSIGVQSFDDNELKAMNRVHNSIEAVNCIEQSLHCIENISIDLMFNLPNQTLSSWEKNLLKAISLNPKHISCYNLTIEEKTKLQRLIKQQKIEKPCEDESVIQFEKTIEMLGVNGFEQYEISNYAQKGFESRHNTNYWFGAKYLGVGPSAHSFDGKNRRWNVSNLNQYLKNCPSLLYSEIENLSIENQYNEFVLTRLRTKWGIPIEEIELRFGAFYAKYLAAQIQNLEDEKLIFIDNKHIILTPKGKLYADSISSQMMSVQ